MELAPSLFIGGLVVFFCLYLWLRQRQQLGDTLQAEQMLRDVPAAAHSDAVLVARAHGQLVYLNDQARAWFGLEGGEPDLEFIAQQVTPSDQFLELFTSDMQLSLQLNNKRWIEAASHHIPAGSETRTVVIMREVSATQQAETLDMPAAMATINEIGETVNASQGVEQVVQALLTIVRKAMPADAGELCLWDEDKRVLTPRGWVGDVAYVLALTEAGGVYREGEGISGYIAQTRLPVLVSNRADERAVRPRLANTSYRSYVGVPLLMGDRLVGTLEFASTQVQGFDRAHLALLQAVSKQVATSVYNAELYAEQVRRVDDIASLGQISATQDGDAGVSGLYFTLGERIARLLAADMCGVLVYNARKSMLIAEAPFYGLPVQLVQTYTIPLQPDSIARDVFHNRDYWMSNDLADEPMVDELRMTTLVNAAGMYNTIIMPMQIGGERFGVLQVGNKRTHGGFTTRDVQNLRIFASQAAVIVQNIRLFQEEKRIDAEIVGLQTITQAIGALRHEDEFYSDINERIARLMDITLCGILLYDEQNEQLVSQPPFYGVDDALAASYIIPIQSGTAMEEIWRNEDYWYSNRVPTDPIIYEAGLGDAAAAMGISKTIIAVLSSSGRRIGIVQASNKRSGEDFTDKDARLLLIFATQAAAMIENARLYQEMRQRADEADSVRRVAELAGAILTSTDSMQPVMVEIARLLQSPLVFINTMSQEGGAMLTEPGSVYGTEITESYVQDTYSRDFDRSVAITRQPFVSNDLAARTDATSGTKALGEHLGLKSLVLVALTVGDRSLGELGVANRARPYTDDDSRLLNALAIQIAAALERRRLHEATGQNLSRRLQELDAISRVSNELNQTLELNRVLDVIRREALLATEALGCTIVMLASRTEWVNELVPELGQRIGDALGVSELVAVETAALQHGGDPIVIDDYPTSPFPPMPPTARSAIAAAIMFANEAVGVIHVYHDAQHHFDSQAATFIMTLAAKASLGYANALRYQENLERSGRLRRRVEQLNQIFELGQMLSGNIDQITMLEAIAYSVQQSAGFDVILMTMVDHETGVLRRIAQAGLPIEQFERSRSITMPLDRVSSLLKDEYRISESYFLPLDRVSDWYTDGAEIFSTAFDGKRSLRPRGKSDWRDGDMLLVPMTGPTGEMVGIMSLDRPFNNQRPDHSIIEILEIFAHQAATTIENNRLYQSSVRAAEQEARLTEVMEAITSTLDITEIVETVARGALRLLPFSRMTVALLDSEQSGFDILWVNVKPDGSLISGKDRRPALDMTAMGRTFETGSDYIYHVTDSQLQAYQDLRTWHINGERTTLIVPLITGGLVLGAMHFGSDLKDAYGFEEYRGLLKRVANLAAVAIQNARLFNQAVNLRLFNESVVESIQQGIVVLDRSGRIIAINDYQKQQFGWDDGALRRDLFAYRPQLTFLADAVRQVMDTNMPQEIVNRRLVTPEGEERVQSFYLYPLLAADSTRGVVLLSEDVTDRTRLEANIESRATQLAALTEVSSRITASLDLEQVIELALTEMQRVISYDSMTLWRRYGSEMEMEGIRPGAEHQLGLRVSIASHDRLSRVVDSHHTYTVSQLQGFDPLPGEDDAHSWLGVPLIRQGAVIGMIALAKREPRFYDQQAEQAALAFANQVAVTLTNAELYSEAQRRTQRLTLLNRVSLALAQSLDIENILEIALREIAQMLRIPRARAYMIEREVKLGRVVVEYPRGDFPPNQVYDVTRHAILTYINRHVQPLIVERLDALEADDPVRAELTERGVSSYLAVPMSVSGQAIGLFELEVPDEVRRFDSEQIDLSLIISNQAAIAVQNANLLEQTLVRTRELETLLEAAQATSYTTDLADVIQNVARLTLQALDMDDCMIALYNTVEDALEVQIDVNRYGVRTDLIPAGTRLPLTDYPMRAAALQRRQVLVIRRTDDNADPRELDDLLRYNNTARMFVPLVARDTAIGLIQVELQSEFRTFTHRDTRMAQALGSQAATAIENARLSTETAARVEELLVINDLSRAISATMDISLMIRIVREQVPNLTNAELLYLALYDAEDGLVRFPIVYRNLRDEVWEDRPIATDEVSFVLRTRRLLSLGGEFTLSEMCRNLGITMLEADATSFLGVPLISGDQVLGVLAVANMREKKPFGLNDQRILTTIGTQLGAAIQNARLYTQIRTFADELNRRVEERTLELQQERDRIDALYRITSELARSLDTDRVLSSALEMVVRTIGADDGLIFLIDPGTDRMFPRASYVQTSELNGHGLDEHPAALLATWMVDNIGAVILDDVQQMPYWDLTHPGAGQFRSALAVLLETNEDVQGAMVFLSRRERVFTEPHLRLVSAAANQVATAINNADLYNLIRDQAERLGMLLRSEQEEAEKSTAILESIADGVILSDATGAIILFNSAAERILGITRASILGEPFRRIAAAFDPVSQDAILRLSEHASDDRPDEYALERLEVGGRIVNVQLSPVFIGEQMLGSVSVFRDVTRDVEVDRMKSMFIANVSHELRTPMTSIKGYADLLIMGAAGQMNDTQQTFINTIKSNADRLKTLVDDLLNISKLDSGRERLRFDDVDLNEMITGVVTNLTGRSKYEQKQMQVNVHVAHDVPFIRADRDRITQILTNIVDNAFNYTYAGGSIDIGVDRRHDKDHVLITVKDTGIGIPQEFQSRIWNRFERFEEHALVMDVAGTGLGLPIARELVEMHGGEIWFESQENVGTTFFISLPIHQLVPGGESVQPQAQSEAD